MPVTRLLGCMVGLDGEGSRGADSVALQRGLGGWVAASRLQRGPGRQRASGGRGRVPAAEYLPVCTPLPHIGKWAVITSIGLGNVRASRWAEVAHFID